MIGLCIPADLSLRGSIVISRCMKCDVPRGCGLFNHWSVSCICSLTSLPQVSGNGSGSRFCSSCGPSICSGHSSSGVGVAGAVGMLGVVSPLLLPSLGLVSCVWNLNLDCRFVLSSSCIFSWIFLRISSICDLLMSLSPVSLSVGWSPEYGYLVPYRFWSSRLKKSLILD